MRFNTLFKLTSILGLAGFVNCKGYRMSFYGETSVDRPSDTAIPACGLDAHYSTDYYVALNYREYDASKRNPNNPNTASVCDKCVKVMYKDKWVVGRIVDRCPGCPLKGLDVSPTIFQIFAHKDTGIVYMDWEYTDCSLLGQKGTCSGGKCTSSSSNSSHSDEDKKEEHKSERKTTTRRRTTTTVKKTTTVKPKPTTETKKETPRPVLDPKPHPISATKIESKIQTADKVPTATTVNEPAVAPQAAPVSQAAPISKSAPAAPAAPSVEKAKDEPTISQATSEKEEGNTYIVPITGALVMSGAAGAALLYAKRENNLTNLKDKFPEAFSNIKRNISRGSSHLRRSLSNSGRALKRSLSKKGNNTSAAGPYIRTKKEYRDSLNAHYPVQLHDPPVTYTSLPRTGASSSHQDYYNVGNDYQLHQFNSYDENDDIQIDFHDSRRI